MNNNDMNPTFESQYAEFKHDLVNCQIDGLFLALYSVIENPPQKGVGAELGLCNGL